MVPFFPTKSAGTLISLLQKSPRCFCSMDGVSAVHSVEDEGTPIVARKSQVVVGWVERGAMLSPETWNWVTLSVEKSTVKPPHGAVASTGPC